MSTNGTGKYLLGKLQTPSSFILFFEIQLLHLVEIHYAIDILNILIYFQVDLLALQQENSSIMGPD